VDCPSCNKHITADFWPHTCACLPTHDSLPAPGCTAVLALCLVIGLVRRLDRCSLQARNTNISYLSSSRSTHKTISGAVRACIKQECYQKAQYLIAVPVAAKKARVVAVRGNVSSIHSRISGPIHDQLRQSTHQSAPLCMLDNIIYVSCLLGTW
jgi:hypothetical protein